MIKQADVVLGMFLLGHEFSGNQKRRNFDYYDPLTTGDSFLSSSIQAIVAAEVGYDDLARSYAFYGALMDLDDVAENVRDGLHIASMGGTWMAVVCGLAGLRDWDGRILFDPRRPVAGTGFRFPLRIRDRRLVVDIGCDSVTHTLEEGDELKIRHVDREIALTRTLPSSTHPLGDPPGSPGGDREEGGE